MNRREIPRRAAIPTAAGLLAAAVGLQAMPGAAAPEPGETPLRETLEDVRARHGLPALWAGRFHADGRRVAAVTGVRRCGEEAAAAIDDQLHIGSCTKAMTAAMIARRVSAGGLSFDSTLGGLFPDLRDEEGGRLADSPWGATTLDELLRHTSGAPANPDWWSLQRLHPDDPSAAREALLRWLVSRERPARREFLYSNTGYALLGHVVESLDGRPWESLLADEVFAPLAIADAGFGPLPSDGRDGPCGHVERDGVMEPVRIDNPPPLGPAGRVHLPLAEWSRFVLAIADDAGGERIGIAPRDRASLLEPREAETYAGGWGIHDRRWGDGRVLTHSGSNTTWYCVAWVAPRRGFCLLSATNSGAPAAVKACDEAVAACLDPGILALEDGIERGRR